MSALAADLTRKRRGEILEFSYVMKASTTIYKGSIVCLNSSGEAIPAAEATGNGNAVGVAKHTQTSAASGTYEIVVQRGVFRIAVDASLTLVDLGDNAFATTDNDADDAAGSTYKINIGEIMDFETGYCWINVGRPRPPRFWTSAEITGSGSEQTNAHTLGKLPEGVFITVTELPDAAAETGFDVALGTHTAAAVLATVTNTVKYRLMAWV